MDRVNRILDNDKYKEFVHNILMFETGREFCKHDMSHFLDVARIAYILVLENHIDIDKELVYASALLHDIGRGAEYRNGTPHDEAGIVIAEQILTESGFNDIEIKIILEAIKYHRNNFEALNDFNKVFAKSDKLSRNCFYCQAAANCNWKSEKRNYKLIY